MIWKIDQEPENGIMFRGQSSVRVKNKYGVVGEAAVRYSPVCRVVGPVTVPTVYTEDGYPDRVFPEVIDSRPTFR